MRTKEVISQLTENTSYEEKILKTNTLPNEEIISLIKSNEKYFISIGKANELSRVSEFGSDLELASKKYTKILDDKWSVN